MSVSVYLKITSEITANNYDTSFVDINCVYQKDVKSFNVSHSFDSLGAPFIGNFTSTDSDYSRAALNRVNTVRDFLPEQQPACHHSRHYQQEYSFH